MLEGHTLVLNRSWVAIHVTPVRRALTLLYLGHARAVDPVNYNLHDFESWCALPKEIVGNGHARYVHTPSKAIAVPDVILASGFNGFIRHEVRFSRQSIFDRDGIQCQYCGKSFSRGHLTLDHVLPTSRGGDDSWDNLVVACHACNVRKADRTPDEAKMPLLRRPKKPAWIPHFGRRIPVQQVQVWERFVGGTHMISA